MTTPIQFKLRTIIANSKLEESQKMIIELYVITLSDINAAKLLAVFTKNPQSVAIYSDYIRDLGEQTEQVSPEKLEEILAPLMGKLS